MKAKEVQVSLRKARALMNNKGAHWTVGKLKRKKNDEYSYCSLGAIYAAVDLRGGGNGKIPNKARPVALALANAIREEAGFPAFHPQDKFDWMRVADTITRFNDSGTVFAYRNDYGTLRRYKNLGYGWETVSKIFVKAAKSPGKYMGKEE